MLCGILLQKKVIIIGLDGLRGDTVRKACVPHLDALMTNGVYSLHAQTETRTVSGSAWTSLLTGVHFNKHNVVGNDFSHRNFEYRTIFCLLKEWNPKLRTVGNSHWKPIITHIFEKKVLNHSASGSDKHMAFRTAKDIENDRGDLYFVQLDDIDGAGHHATYGPDSKEYIQKIEVTDNYVGYILDAVKKRPKEENWLICCVSDHGGINKSHGGISEAELTILLIISGNCVTKKGVLSYSEEEFPMITDVVPSIAAFLGYPPRPEWDGHDYVFNR